MTATAPGGLLTLSGADADTAIDLTGTAGSLITEFGIAVGPTNPTNLLTQGAVECLFKPFSETALLDALNVALRMR